MQTAALTPRGSRWSQGGALSCVPSPGAPAPPTGAIPTAGPTPAAPKSAVSSILGTWLDQYLEDFCQPPDFPCLKQLVAYVQLNMPSSDLERRARLLLAQLECAEPAQAEPEATPPSKEPGPAPQHP
ncbi:ral guanine nucleotide dissociation stimulator-like [Mustela erminea]|uniref:ral guanine nucleotide dissociation stimulator-like n=1 Tax=Mustela erminea TaxID=36723 RepID=UPI001386728F|nr:ral guanine nucleotide dissociation stimulator-like [Mustela erminea]